MRDPSQPPRGDPQPPLRLSPWILWIVGVYMALAIVSWLIPHGPPQAALPYTAFHDQLEADNVAAIHTSGPRIDGTFKHPVRSGRESYGAFTTVLPPFSDGTLWPLLLKNKVDVTAAPPGISWWPVVASVLPVFVLIALFVLMGRQVGRGQSSLFGFGRSNAREYAQGRPGVTFADVAGEDEAKEALRDVVDFLRHPAPFRAVGARIPRGVLLVGPPGTGKTLLARAVAGEAGSTFYSAAATEFVEMFVGVGAARVRDLFRQAKASAPAIVFLDEIDAVGRRRGAAMGPGNEEREQTLNQLLGELDGFEPNVGVVILAATNRPDMLDPALLRPGRFDRQVTLGLPDRPVRDAILRVHARQVAADPDVDFALLARSTAGFSGADLANLINEAAIVAARRRASAVSMEDFGKAQDRIVMGGLTGVKMTDAERRIVAYHEAGHALVAVLSEGADPVWKVSIVPRDRSLGATLQVPLDDHRNYSREYLLTRLVILLGGRASEELVFHERTTGAEDDLRHGIMLARRMVSRWGMAGDLGLTSPDPSQPLGAAFGAAEQQSDATAARIDRETAALLGRAHDRALHLLRAHRQALDRVARALMEEEVLELPALRQLVTPESGQGAGRNVA